MTTTTTISLNWRETNGVCYWRHRLDYSRYAVLFTASCFMLLLLISYIIIIILVRLELSRSVWRLCRRRWAFRHGQGITSVVVLVVVVLSSSWKELSRPRLRRPPCPYIHIHTHTRAHAVSEREGDEPGERRRREKWGRTSDGPSGSIDTAGSRHSALSSSLWESQTAKRSKEKEEEEEEGGVTHLLLNLITLRSSLCNKLRTFRSILLVARIPDHQRETKKKIK